MEHTGCQRAHDWLFDCTNDLQCVRHTADRQINAAMRWKFGSGAEFPPVVH
jgi:hypothetical protein